MFQYKILQYPLPPFPILYTAIRRNGNIFLWRLCTTHVAAPLFAEACPCAKTIRIPNTVSQLKVPIVCTIHLNLNVCGKDELEVGSILNKALNSESGSYRYAAYVCQKKLNKCSAIFPPFSSSKVHPPFLYPPISGPVSFFLGGGRDKKVLAHFFLEMLYCSDAIHKNPTRITVFAQ